MSEQEIELFELTYKWLDNIQREPDKAYIYQGLFRKKLEEFKEDVKQPDKESE